METSTNINESCFNDLDCWTIWFNNKMSIFNITDDTKTFIKEYIEMKKKDIKYDYLTRISYFNINKLKDKLINRGLLSK